MHRDTFQEKWELIASGLLNMNRGVEKLFDPVANDISSKPPAQLASQLNSAFLCALTGEKDPEQHRARVFLKKMAGDRKWSKIAGFYLDGLELIPEDLWEACNSDPEFKRAFFELAQTFEKGSESGGTSDNIREKVWEVFFPEGCGIDSDRESQIDGLRCKRTVTLGHLNNHPISNPFREVLLTSNVLLTIPPEGIPAEELNLSDSLKDKIREVSHTQQKYWYDHPIQMGADPKTNEAVYGLLGLAQAVEFERSQPEPVSKVRCLLSVSVTHPSLRAVAAEYLEQELGRHDLDGNLELYVVTETDARQIIEQVLVPAAQRYLGIENAKELLEPFGVDGEYGRHYSFLKAISALWNVLIDRDIRATFKIDLDQVFPQKELVSETGKTAFEHFKTPLWGARGVDTEGGDVELGMIAGALVNESDIEKSLFTPDVRFPSDEPTDDELVFFSKLPQALSTEAEMMTRYSRGELDGVKKCIQRVHVTGGTNGILVNSLRRHRPFTPSFFGRAEDQAYILSTFENPGPTLAYAHEEGLIMRHDKQAFAQEAIKAASVGKLLGDYVRIILFSAYAEVLSEDRANIKNRIDPFTGCFASRIPITVVLLRFALKANSFFAQGESEQGLEFVELGSSRIPSALQFVSSGSFEDQYRRERQGWQLYYDILDSIEQALVNGEEAAEKLREQADKILQGCRLAN
jgi:hypothetical protein